MQFLFYGGKGGVGKTTCAAARAVAAARASARVRQKVLIVSTDPAHSLGDALGVRLSSRPKRLTVGGRAAATLDAVELDAPRAFARWLDANRRALGDVLEHGTWLDREDIDAMLGLSLPGIDELIGLIEIDRLARGKYDRVIVDTAPTGHTLRLLASPDAVAAVARILDALQAEHRLVREQLARVNRPEAADRLIAALAEQAREAGERLRDARTAFHWVLLPEELSIAESEDGLRALDRARIRVAEVIVNRVTPDGPPCPVCDRRRAAERGAIAQLARRLGRSRTIRLVEAAVREPRGIAALARLGKDLDAPPQFKTHQKGRPTYGGHRFSSASRAAATPFETSAAFKKPRLLLFGGKGGAGKTTCAAAAAIRVARANDRARVLLLSTDPAHSLGDVFGVSIGDRARTIPGAPKNMRVRELDAAAALAARRASIEAALDEIASALGAAGSVSDEGVGELMDLAPPGIDELLGMLSVAELADAQAPTIVIVDTAPTGHALRLLEAPDTARQWVQLLMRVLLKYRNLARPGQLGAELLSLSQSIGRLQHQLRDPDRTAFIVVTRASAVTRVETTRLLGRLRRLRLPVPVMLVNAMTLAPGRCPRCRAVAAAEAVERAALARACRPRRCAMIVSPLSAPPPRGAAALERYAGTWRHVAAPG